VNFRSFEDLAQTVRRNLQRVPHDIDVVVGVPRSGMIPASMISLHRNTALTDVDGLLEGRAFQPGIRRKKARIRANPEAWENVLVIDDSVGTGGTIAEVRARIAASGRPWNVRYYAVYGTQAEQAGVDVVFEACPLPRVFEWNLMHHPHVMADACLDIDGLLCVDPTAEENDDGPLYDGFLRDARPLLLPTVPVGTLVSSRLEKCRAATEDWLHRHGVEYGELCLLDLPSAEERRRLKAHAAFKADVYRSKKRSWFFLESESSQAREIAARSGKAVICTTDMTLFDETGPKRAVRVLRQRVGAKKRALWRLKSRLWSAFNHQLGYAGRQAGDHD